MPVAAAAVVLWVRLLPLKLGALDDAAGALVEGGVERTVEAGLPPGLSPELRQAEVRACVMRWQQQHRAQFDAERKQMAEHFKSAFTFRDGAGVERVLLGDMDSYHWLRMARNYLRTGTTCDAVVAGQCRDTYANAPVGRQGIYNRSLHIAVIVAIHRLITFFKPTYPLSSSSFFVPVLVGVLGVFPAYALGALLAGEAGGVCAALISALNPLFLQRSIGSDDDVWNVVIPLFVMWAASEAIGSSHHKQQAGFAMLAGMAVGFDAATWSGWPLAAGAVLVALAANLLLETAAGLITRFKRESRSVAGLQRAVLVLVGFYLSAGLCATVAGRNGFGFPLGLVRPLIAAPRPSPGTAATTWPNIFISVSELAPTNLKSIEALVGGPYCFGIALLGLVAVLAPAKGPGWRHLALLLGAGVFDTCLVVSGLGRVGMVALVAAPPGAALLMDLLYAPERASEPGPAVILIVWFLAGLWLSYQGMRFVMLLVAPLALAFGAAVGRLDQWAEEWMAWIWPAAARFSYPILLAGVTAVLFVPVQQGYAAARDYMPMINRAWWDTLNILHQQSPPDAIVNTWWDYGYWTEYVAQRRVNNDGASLRLHIPYWTAAALASSSENESAGILRMLDCGSDATPDPEGKEGAYEKLVAHGVDGVLAPGMITTLAGMNRKQAQAFLAEQGLSADAQADVLRSTHCRPPVSYLLLSSAIQPVQWWWGLATWDFRRAYIAKNARSVPEAKAVPELVSRLGYSEGRARALYDSANSLDSRSAEQNFISPDTIGPRTPWIKCRGTGGSIMTCQTGSIPDDGSVIIAVRYDSGNPAGARIVTVRRLEEKDTTFRVRQVPPAAVVIAGARWLQSIVNPGAENPDVGVLIDVPGARVMLGPPSLMRSTFSRLMYLDGRYDNIFQKVHEETGAGGVRVTLWRINWQRLEAIE